MNLRAVILRGSAGILYPELSFLLRCTTSLSTLILQDFVKFRNSKSLISPSLLGELFCGGKNEKVKNDHKSFLREN